MNRVILLPVVIFFFAFTKSFSQGCSDAGFCTIGALAPYPVPDSSFKYLAKLSVSYGIGEQRTKHLQLIPELEVSFIKKNTIQLKVPYVSVHGNLGDNSGVGDVALSISQKIIDKENSDLSVTVGVKLPTGTTNTAENGISLPMPYQTGLGTTDLILGVSYKYKKWNLSSGYQRVLNNKNENGFLHSTDNSDVANKYFESNLLDRGDDALIRIERNFPGNKIKLFAGILAIYRLEADKIINDAGTQVALKGSDGLTLNVTGRAQYDFSVRSGVSLLFGTPVKFRDVRADGLTRKLVLTASYQVRFGR